MENIEEPQSVQPEVTALAKPVLPAIVVTAIITAIVVGAGTYFLMKDGGPAQNTACSQEAKICPDGSAVGRTGPNCSFAACPAVPAPALTETPSPVVTSDPIAGWNTYRHEEFGISFRYPANLVYVDNEIGTTLSVIVDTQEAINFILNTSGGFPAPLISVNVITTSEPVRSACDSIDNSGKAIVSQHIDIGGVSALTCMGAGMEGTFFNAYMRDAGRNIAIFSGDYEGMVKRDFDLILSTIAFTVE